MTRLYVYNDAHNGDLIFTRPLYRKLLASGCFDLVIGGARNRAYIFEDFEAMGATLLVSPYADGFEGLSVGLARFRPEDCVPISTWLGEYEDTREHQWRNVVEVFLRQCREHGVDVPVDLEPDRTPMVDFTRRLLHYRLNGPTVYLDDSTPRGRHSTFLFDQERLALRYPGISFLCTSPPRYDLPNLLDGSRLDLRDLSALSNECLAILGKASGPFCCTYTEPNRFKPRAVCGYRSDVTPTFWDYEGNPLLYLDTMDEVFDFLDGILPDANPGVPHSPRTGCAS